MGTYYRYPKHTWRHIGVSPEKAGKIWREHGALDHKECAGDDLAIEGMVPFTRGVTTRAGENSVFASRTWIKNRSRSIASECCTADSRSLSMRDEGMHR